MGGLTQNLLWIYRTVVRPILSYSATVWDRAQDNKHDFKKPERVQDLALRIIAGAFPSTPFDSLNHLTETPHIKGEAVNGAARLQVYNDWTVKIAKVSRVPLNPTAILI